MVFMPIPLLLKKQWHPVCLSLSLLTGGPFLSYLPHAHLFRPKSRRWPKSVRDCICPWFLGLFLQAIGWKEASLLVRKESRLCPLCLLVPTYLGLCSHLWLCLPATGIVFSQFHFSAKTLRRVRISWGSICFIILEFRTFKNLKYLRTDI